MKIIVKQAVEQLSGDKKELDDRKILDYIKAHPYFDSAFPCNSMVKEIKEKIK